LTIKRGLKMQNTAQDVQDYSGRGDSDFSGKGSMFAKPVAQDGIAQMNQASLGAGTRPAPVATINSNIATNILKKKQGEQQGGQAAASAAYASEAFDFDQIFDGEGLTEEFKEKIKVVFEAAVNERVNVIAEALMEEANSTLEEEVQTIAEGLSQKLDDYLNYVVEEWMTENKLALEEGIRMDIAESFLGGLKELFETHYVSVPEGKNDILENLNSSNEQLEKELNEKIEENIMLQKALVEQQCGIVFLEATDGLTDVQIEKLASLAEGLQYDTVEQYAEKLNILKESYFKPVSSDMRETVESLEETTDKRILQPNDTMGVYLSAISRQAKKTSL
jgi:hypothetical protein